MKFDSNFLSIMAFAMKLIKLFFESFGDADDKKIAKENDIEVKPNGKAEV